MTPASCCQAREIGIHERALRAQRPPEGVDRYRRVVLGEVEVLLREGIARILEGAGLEVVAQNTLCGGGRYAITGHSGRRARRCAGFRA
jgi:hypothetical protein